VKLLSELRRRVLPTLEEEESDPLDWRERVLFTILAVVLLLGVMTAVPSIALLLRDGMYGTIAIDLAALTAAAILTFHRGIPFTWRAGALITICYALGVWFLFTVGFVSQLYLMAVPVLAALLLGLRPALWALGIVAMSLGLGGFLLDANLAVGRLDGNPLSKWALVTLNFLFVDAVLTVSVAVLLQRLERSLTAEQESAVSFARLARAVEQSHEVILISDASGEIVYANRVAQEFTGAQGDASSPRQLTALRAADGEPDSLASALRDAQEWRGTVLQRTPDGKERLLESVVAPLRGEDGQVLNFVAVLRDVTHERDMEARLRQGQKLEAIGTLTGGIAHDFNNIVASILGVAELTKTEPTQEGVTAGLDQIIVACDRARDIVRQMMAFSRHSALEREPLVLAMVVEEALPLLRASIPSTIAFRTTLEARGHALVQRSDVHQILMNLASNGAHAMNAQGTGTLEFRLTSIRADASLVTDVPRLREGERYLKLEVADTGHGIPEEHLDRLFDPFFTTKSQSEGTGLGLASVHGIVRALEGGIGVRSEVGRGTTFSVYIPELATVTAEHLIEAASAPTPSLPASSGRLLLVDDEPLLLEVQAIVLRRAGYEVTATRDSAEARTLLTEDPFRFDLIITDLSMPRVSGLDLIRVAHAIRPDARVILASGFSDAARQEELAAAGVSAFLQKPYTQAELLRLVQRVMD
jgi:PAS domain S-box-containing protein